MALAEQAGVRAVGVSCPDTKITAAGLGALVRPVGAGFIFGEDDDPFGLF